MSKVTVYAEPALEPVTPHDLMTHARIDSHDEEEFLATLLKDARVESEKIGRVKLVTQTIDEYFDDWADPLVLYWSPVQSIASVTYLDSNGTTQTLATSVYELGDQFGIGCVRLKYNQAWPVVRGHEDAICIRYVAGFGATAASVPSQYVAAVRVHAAHRYRFRDGEPLPQGFYDLLAVDGCRHV